MISIDSNGNKDKISKRNSAKMMKNHPCGRFLCCPKWPYFSNTDPDDSNTIVEKKEPQAKEKEKTSIGKGKGKEMFTITIQVKR